MVKKVEKVKPKVVEEVSDEEGFQLIFFFQSFFSISYFFSFFFHFPFSFFFSEDQYSDADGEGIETTLSYSNVQSESK